MAAVHIIQYVDKDKTYGTLLHLSTGDADDTADDGEIEDDIEYDGPFQCTRCDTLIQLRHGRSECGITGIFTY